MHTVRRLGTGWSKAPSFRSACLCSRNPGRILRGCNVGAASQGGPYNLPGARFCLLKAVLIHIGDVPGEDLFLLYLPFH
jgi:hypothetical protein